LALSKGVLLAPSRTNRNQSAPRCGASGRSVAPGRRRDGFRHYSMEPEDNETAFGFLSRVAADQNGISSWCDPRWDEVSKVHDWRNHVPSSVYQVWDMLPAEARLVAFVMAQEQASREEWD
jgi:hypothetical protein